MAGLARTLYLLSGAEEGNDAAPADGAELPAGAAPPPTADAPPPAAAAALLPTPAAAGDDASGVV